VSTEDWQDPVTSRARQLEQAEALVRGHGTIVAEFFDAGESRMVAWARRPQAAALVAALADPGRGWDAIVIGEYERAFYGGQYVAMAPLLEHYGVQLWMPEAGGRVDYASEHDEQAMTVLGLSSKREITRTSTGSGPRWPPRPGGAGTWAAARPTGTSLPMRVRTRTMHTPPRAGRRTASSPTRRRGMWCGGCSRSGWRGRAWRGSPRALNGAGIPCPSAADPERNPHRTGSAWTLGTVAIRRAARVKEEKKNCRSHGAWRMAHGAWRMAHGAAQVTFRPATKLVMGIYLNTETRFPGCGGSQPGQQARPHADRHIGHAPAA
jgi:site-specific DNA recombinase